MEKLISNHYVNAQAIQLAKRPKRVKIADYISVALLFGFCAYVAVISVYYNGGHLEYGSVPYNEASYLCLVGMVLFGAVSYVAYHTPYPVGVSNAELEKAFEILTLKKRIDLENKFSKAENDLIRAQKEVMEKKKLLLILRHALENF